MGWPATLGILGGALLVVLLARWRMAMPLEPGRVRMVPWTGVLFLAVLLAVMMFAHMLTLWGVERH